MGPKDDCLLAFLRLDPFCDTTSTLFTPNLTVEEIGKMDLCMILGPKVAVICCKNRRKQLLYRYLSTACHRRGAGVEYTCV